MTVKMTTSILKNVKLNSTDKIVISYINNIIELAGEFKLKNSEVSGQLGMSNRTVSRSINKLVKLGYITSVINNINFINVRTIELVKEEIPTEKVFTEDIKTTTLEEINNPTINKLLGGIDNNIISVNNNNEIDTNRIEDVKKILPLIKQMKTYIKNPAMFKFNVMNNFEQFRDEQLKEEMVELKYKLIEELNYYKIQYNLETTLEAMNNIIDVSLTDQFVLKK